MIILIRGTTRRDYSNLVLTIDSLIIINIIVAAQITHLGLIDIELIRNYSNHREFIKYRTSHSLRPLLHG